MSDNPLKKQKLSASNPPNPSPSLDPLAALPVRTPSIPPARIADLLSVAEQARDRAYCPYSRFRVGAAILVKENKKLPTDKEQEEEEEVYHVVAGCNVENCSYGLTMCAERAGLFSMVSQYGVGRNKESSGVTVMGILVTSDMEDKYTTPCCACRQVMIEFGLDYDVFLARKDGQYRVLKMRDLVPLPFCPEDLLTHQPPVNSN
eukprot:Nk52_evm16s553 gene=Nk52_evmTU16s553